MPPRPELSRSELEIVRIVWRLREARVRQVADALPPERELDFFTVQTFLRRLKTKGYLRTRRDGRADVYLPAIPPSRVIGRVVNDLIDRVFEGRALPLMQHLIEERGLSKDELAQLQSTLDQLKPRGKR